jgi:hypothetical protein
MPILRWIRQTESSICSASSADFQARNMLLDQRVIEVEQKGRFDAPLCTRLLVADSIETLQRLSGISPPQAVHPALRWRTA